MQLPYVQIPGLSSSSADATYLRLDATNDPVTGALTIDVTDGEAFLVRRGGDAQDVFTVDTTTNIQTIGVNRAPENGITFAMTGREFAMTNVENNALGPGFLGQKTRGGSETPGGGSPAQSGDTMMSFSAEGDDGTTGFFIASGKLIFAVQGAVSAGAVPCSFEVLTSDTSGNQLTAIFSDNTQQLGVAHTSPDRLFHPEIADSATNTVTNIARFSHVTSGTAAANFGIGVEYELESAAGTNRIAGLTEYYWSDATDGLEDATYDISLMQGGTTTTVFSMNSFGSLVLGSGAAGVDLTITFDGETSDGVITWYEDESVFSFDSALHLPDDTNISYGNTPASPDVTVGWVSAASEFLTTVGGSSSIAITSNTETHTITNFTFKPIANGIVWENYAYEAAANLNFKRAQGSDGAETSIVNGAILHQTKIWGYHSDGSAYIQGAEQRYVVDAAIGATAEIPTRWEVHLTKDGSSTMDRVWMINNAGDITIGSGVAGKDYSITFDGETNDGILTWLEDEAQFDFDSQVNIDITGLPLNIQNDTDASSVQVLTAKGADRSSPVSGDEAYFSFYNKGRSGNQEEYGRFTWIAADITNGSEEGRLTWDVMETGALEQHMVLDSTGLLVGQALGVATPSANLHVVENNAGAVFRMEVVDSTINVGDDVFTFDFQAGEAASAQVAKIMVEADLSWGVTSSPTRMSFWTTLSGQTTAQQRMTIFNDGDVTIGTTTPTAQFAVVSGATHLPLSDLNDAQDYGYYLRHSSTSNGRSVGWAMAVDTTFNQVGAAIIFERTGTNSKGHMHLLNRQATGAGNDPEYAITLQDTGSVKTYQGRVVNTTRVTTTYTVLVTDHVVFANTDSGAYTVTLPAGAEGQTVKIINSGSSGNNLTLAPDGAEHLLGANSNFTLTDAETLILTYNATDGWY